LPTRMNTAAIRRASRSAIPPAVTLAAVLIYGVFDFAEVGGPMFARTLRDAYLGRGAARCSKTRTDLRGFAMRNSSDRLSCSTAGWRVCTAVR